MNAQTLLESFETFADAPGGISRLRELILELAVAGRLTEQHHRLPPHASQVEEARKAKGPQLKKKGANGIPLERLPNESEYPFSLPLGWIFVRIDDVAEYFNGCAFKAGDHSNTGLPIIRIQNLTNNEAEFNYTKLVLDTRNIAQSGDILVSWSATLDAFKWSGPTGGVNQHIFKVEPNTDLVSQGFLHQVLRWTMKRLAASEALHGLAMKHVNRGDFTAAIIPLPPLDEQREIELRLQQLFELCDQLEAAKAERDSLRTAARKSAIDAVSTASTTDELSAAWVRIRDNWTTFADTPESISDLRSIILDLALQGHLSSASASDTSVQALLDLIQQQHKPHGDMSPSRYSVPDHWKWISLGTIADHQLGKMLNKSRTAGVTRKYLRTANIASNGKFDLSEVKEMLVPNDELDKYSVRKGDLFVNEGGDVGKSAIWTSDAEDFAFQNHLHRLRPQGGITSRFLQLVLQQARNAGTLLEMSAGVTIQNLSANTIRKLACPLPPLEEQERIVTKIDELMALCNEIEEQLKVRNDLAVRWAASVVHHIGDAA